MVGHRGLETDTDLQTFEIFIPQKLRKEWETVLDRISDSVRYCMSI